MEPSGELLKSTQAQTCHLTCDQLHQDLYFSEIPDDSDTQGHQAPGLSSWLHRTLLYTELES